MNASRTLKHEVTTVLKSSTLGHGLWGATIRHLSFELATIQRARQRVGLRAGQRVGQERGWFLDKDLPHPYSGGRGIPNSIRSDRLQYRIDSGQKIMKVGN